MSNFNENTTDCLVLKLEEIDSTKKDIDTTVYILFDTKKLTYIIRGKRSSTLKYNNSTYSFECNNKKDLVCFLQYIICPFNNINETLFNYKNLPKNPNYITFEYLKQFENKNNEISGYDNQKLLTKRLMKNLRMLENINNHY
jgi:hypothetical protein